jgi:hypothetical protein
MHSYTNFLAAGDSQGAGRYLFQARCAFSDAAMENGDHAFIGLQANIPTPANVEPNTELSGPGAAIW